MEMGESWFGTGLDICRSGRVFSCPSISSTDKVVHGSFLWGSIGVEDLEGAV